MTSEPRFVLSGGDLALDFVNTVGGMRGVRPSEHLHGYADLIAFARQASALAPEDAAGLLAEAERHPDAAAAVLGEATALREALYRLFLAAARCEAPPGEDMAIMNRALGVALSHRRLRAGPEAGGWTLGWSRATSLDAPLWPIAAAAAALLASNDLGRVRVCGMYDDRECSWLFLDRTKGRTKRWCSMKDCGNRAKARRHYARCKCAPETEPAVCPPGRRPGR